MKNIIIAAAVVAFLTPFSAFAQISTITDASTGKSFCRDLAVPASVYVSCVTPISQPIIASSNQINVTQLQAQIVSLQALVTSLQAQIALLTKSGSTVAPTQTQAPITYSDPRRVPQIVFLKNEKGAAIFDVTPQQTIHSTDFFTDSSLFVSAPFSIAQGQTATVAIQSKPTQIGTTDTFLVHQFGFTNPSGSVVYFSGVPFQGGN